MEFAIIFQVFSIVFVHKENCDGIRVTEDL